MTGSLKKTKPAPWLHACAGFVVSSFLFSDDLDKLSIQVISIAGSDLFPVDCGQGHLAAGGTLFDAILDLDVQIGEFLLETAVDLH